jgi:hypothetical protein
MSVEQLQQNLPSGFDTRENIFDLLGGNITVAFLQFSIYFIYSRFCVLDKGVGFDGAVRSVALPASTSRYLGFTSHFIPKRASFPSTVIRQRAESFRWLSACLFSGKRAL